jgi:hypothetical protein
MCGLLRPAAEFTLPSSRNVWIWIYHCMTFISRKLRQVYSVLPSARTFGHSACSEIQGKFYLRKQPIGMYDLRRLRPWMWRLVSSGLSCRICTDISEQPRNVSNNGNITARVYCVTFQETAVFRNEWMESPVTESSISRYAVEVRAEHITEARQQTSDTC